MDRRKFSKEKAKKFLFEISFLALTLFFFTIKVYAGFPVGRGKTLISLTYSPYFSNRVYDKDWKLQPNVSGGYFLSHYMSLSANYGLTRHWNLYGSIPYIIETAKSNQTNRRANDFGDANIGLSYNVWNKKYTRLLTLKSSGYLPMYRNEGKELPIGYELYGFDAGINYTINPVKSKKKGYYTIDALYRHYFSENGPDQFLASLSKTYLIKPFSFLVLSTGFTYSYSTNQQTQLNPNLNMNFVNTRVLVGFGRRITRTKSLYIDGYVNPYGQNAGLGYGGTLSVMIKFP